jgi:hypothetical protein
LRLFQNFSFGKATLKFAVLQGFKPEKPQEPLAQACPKTVSPAVPGTLAHSQIVLEQPQFTPKK